MERTLLLGIIAICLWRIVLLHRATRIIRHLFIDSSDWSSRMIAEVVESASFHIREMAADSAKFRGNDISQRDMDEHIPDVVSTANVNWANQKNRFQAVLSANRIRPLDERDLDELILDTPAWFKSVPRPQRVTHIDHEAI